MNRISNFFRGILQKIIIWAYTPTPEESEQTRADDLAKIAALGDQAREEDKIENVGRVGHI